jgi:hypothetical protein
MNDSAACTIVTIGLPERTRLYGLPVAPYHSVISLRQLTAKNLASFEDFRFSHSLSTFCGRAWSVLGADEIMARDTAMIVARPLLSM